MRIYLVCVLFSCLNLFTTAFADDGAIPKYPCYRTVEATYETAVAITEKHPTLATWIDVGDSWEKTADEGGYDLFVLRLTNSEVSGDKPKLFVSSAIHAREYTTAELMTRFAEHLVDNYGTDPDITWMLDHHEAHFLLQGNPDGRKKAEAGNSWRKTTNRNYCGTNSSNRGVDLNRNFDYRWGNVGSSRQCSETYRGPSAASEPETQTIQNYLRLLFRDRRGEGMNDMAPLDTSGVYLDMHAYGELIYSPSGSANDRQITTLNRKFTFFSGYSPRSPVDFYREPWEGGLEEQDMRNHTYSFGYGDLGVASYLFELGTSFFQSCSYFTSSIIPKNIPSLLYALKVVRAPYMLPSGPDAYELEITKADTGELTLSAKINDKRYNNSQGTERTDDVSEAEYYINTPPWVEGAVPLSLAAVDGEFDEKIEDVKSVLDISAVENGRHILFVRGKDSAGNWGPVSAIFLDVAK